MAENSGHCYRDKACLLIAAWILVGSFLTPAWGTYSHFHSISFSKGAGAADISVVSLVLAPAVAHEHGGLVYPAAVLSPEASP